jgi:hypothetical protein
MTSSRTNSQSKATKSHLLYVEVFRFRACLPLFAAAEVEVFAGRRADCGRFSFV